MRRSKREGEIKGENRVALANIPFCANGRNFLQYLEKPLIVNDKRYGQDTKTQKCNNDIKYFTHRNTPYRAKRKGKEEKALLWIFISFPFLILNIMMKEDINIFLITNMNYQRK